MTNTTGIIYPSDPFNDHIPDTAFANETEAIRFSNIPISTFEPDSLVDGIDGVRFRKLPKTDNGTAKLFYRGWMLTAEEYTTLYNALQTVGIQMVSTPENYISAHHLPGWYHTFQELTPKTIIIPADADRESIQRNAEELHAQAYIVKDFVKSRKDEWETACYSPSLETLPSIVEEFVRLQEDYLVGGIAIREFVELDKTEPETRIWWTHTQPTLITPHPDYFNQKNAELSEEFLYKIKERVEQLGSPFITTDVAKTVTGEWVVIEVGDGQVSGLPDGLEAEKIEKLFKALLG